MSIECGCYPAFYIKIDDMAPSVGTEFCLECGRLIPCGEEFYTVWHWRYNLDAQHEHLAKLACCEQCGDLAMSWMELGYCWERGQLRVDIAELNAL